MLMNSFALDDLEGFASPMRYPALAGKRVLITGVTAAAGVDIVRAFADHRTELVVEMAEQSEAMQALAEIAAESALDLTLLDPTSLGSEPGREGDILAMARKGCATYGGIDAVVNIISLDPAAAANATSLADVEARISDIFLKACLVGRVAANRMRLTHTAGVVLNVAVNPPTTGRARAFASVARATLATITRGEAQGWASDGIRFNAIAPLDATAIKADDDALPVLTNEPEIANLALFLATGHGKSLSGLVFDRAFAG